MSRARDVVLSLLLAGCSGGGCSGCGHADADLDGWIKPGDCDDNDASVNPDEAEVPNDGIDQDCDGADITDADGDGYDSVDSGGDDCNDYNADVYPGRPHDKPYDGLDANCDGKSDNDQDEDGFAAAGHGGEDCDDEDPDVVPVDVDGDGYDPCDGDCDETDPGRHRGAEPICGNDVDDDCDGASDCALTGDLALAENGARIEGTGAVSDHGWTLAGAGDLTGDGRDDLVVTALLAGVEHALIYEGPFAGVRTSDAAWADLGATSNEVLPVAAGDLAGADGIAELLLGEPGAAVPRAVLVAPAPGAADLASGALLQVLGEPGDETGRALGVVGDRIAVGAPSRGNGDVYLLPATTAGTVAFGDPPGFVLTGVANERTGAGLLALGDGGLVVGGPGTAVGLAAAMYVLPSADAAGSVADLAQARIDTHAWGLAGSVLAAGDLDGDDAEDLVIGGPFAYDVGAVAVLTALDADLDVEDAPILRYAIGDDALGEALAVGDFDDDGNDDLLAGGPASRDGGGGLDKAGAVYVWYGPLEAGTGHTVGANLVLVGADTGGRTLAGHALALGELDDVVGTDLAIGSPRNGLGVVDVITGGQSGASGL